MWPSIAARRATVVRVTLQEPPPPTRRELRRQRAGEREAEAVSATTAPVAPVATASVEVVVPAEVTALRWVDELAVAAGTRSTGALTTGPGATFVAVTPDLLARAPRRSPLRPGVLTPIVIVLALVAAYCATTLLWPLYAVAPTVTSFAAQPAAAPAAAPAWPAEGSAAVAVAGFDAPAASTSQPSSMASITKVVTALLVLDRMPLAVGESGPEFRFDESDESSYWAYRSRGESSLPVPVDGTLSQLQLLEGMLIGSAGNYAERLATNIWPTDAVFANAANTWLSQHGISGITVAEPTGIDPANQATPEALMTLAKRALANPVIAQIVAMRSVDLPGAGVVENTNDLLADPGVVGIKTGTLDAYNLLAAKDLAIGDTTVRVYATALDQPDDDARDAATRALFDRLAQELQPAPSVTAGTTVGQVHTLWGDPVSIVTTTDASVVLWNGASAAVATDFALGDHRAAGDVVGSLTATGPLDSDTVDAKLAGEVEGPSPWWRLTHPLQLFGLA